MITKFYKHNELITKHKIYGVTCKNDLPSVICDSSYITYYCHDAEHRDNDLTSFMGLHNNKFYYSKFDTKFRYNGYDILLIPQTGGNISDFRFYKFINGICCELLKKEL